MAGFCSQCGTVRGSTPFCTSCGFRHLQDSTQNQSGQRTPNAYPQQPLPLFTGQEPALLTEDQHTKANYLIISIWAFTLICDFLTAVSPWNESLVTTLGLGSLVTVATLVIGLPLYTRRHGGRSPSPWMLLVAILACIFLYSVFYSIGAPVDSDTTEEGTWVLSAIVNYIAYLPVPILGAAMYASFLKMPKLPSEKTAKSTNLSTEQKAENRDESWLALAAGVLLGIVMADSLIIAFEYLRTFHINFNPFVARAAGLLLVGAGNFVVGLWKSLRNAKPEEGN